MIASKEQGTLRDTYIAANDNLIKIINPAIFSQPTIITYHQVPRRLDDDIVLDDKALAQAGICFLETINNIVYSYTYQLPKLRYYSYL